MQRPGIKEINSSPPTKDGPMSNSLASGDIPTDLSSHGQAVLTWLLEISTSTEILGVYGHTSWPGWHNLHILAFLSRDWARRR